MDFLEKRSIKIWLITSMLQVAAFAFNMCPIQTLKCQGVNFTSVRCSWDSPSINSEYTVQWILDSSTSICEGSKMINGSFICDINNLGSGNSYRYIQLRVKSHPDNQTKVFKNNYLAMQCAIPNPPNEVDVKPLSSNSFQVIWTVPKYWPIKNENLLVYQIQYRSQFDPANVWRTALGSHAQDPPYSLNVTSLPYRCSAYDVKIISSTSGVTGRQSAWSNVVSVRTIQLAPIGEMHDIDFQDLHDKDGSRSILLMWKPIPLTQTCSPLLGYHIMVCNVAKCPTTSISANRTRYYVKDLEKELVYTIYLSAYNSAGQSKSTNITIPGLPTSPEAKNDNSKERYLLYIGLVVALTILSVIVICLVYRKLKSLFEPVPEPHIPFYPEYKLNPNPYKSPEDKEFYTLLNECSEGNKIITRNAEDDKVKEPVYQYRSVSVSDTGELEVVEYQLLLCEDYVKPSSEKDMSQDSSNGSIYPYSKITESTVLDTSLCSSRSRSDSSIIAKQGEVLEKKLQERKCKFIVCREDGYAVIVEDVRAQKTEGV